MITQADLAELFKVNPLAAEQLKAIVLQRRVVELEAELAVLKTNGS
jgi:hypothetical protein